MQQKLWGYRKCDQLERVHLFAYKRFLHVLNKTPNDVVYGELGRYPLWISATARRLKYWFKLLRQPEQLYSRKAYSMLLKMHEGAVTWVTHVKSILCDNGFEQVWLFSYGIEKYFFRELKERLYSSFCHGWRNHLESSDKLSLYSQHKNCFKRNTYIDILWLDVYRNALAQFRMGVSQINEHRYRFAQTTENVLCRFGCSKPENEIYVCLNARSIRYYSLDICQIHSLQITIIKSTLCVS